MLDVKKHAIIMDGAYIPAVPLALTEDLLLDERRQRALIRYYLEAGVDGIAAAVHTTQFEIREHPETYRRLLEVIVEEIDGFENKNEKQIIKIAGICGKLDQAREEASRVLSLGYDIGLLSLAAYGGDSSMNELIQHYQAVTEIIPVFGFYLQQAVGGIYLSYDFWCSVLENENVIGVKAAAFDRYKTVDVARACANTTLCRNIPAALYTGNDDNIVVDLLTSYSFPIEGGVIDVPIRGGLLGHWSVWVRTAVQLFHEIKKSRGDERIPRSLIHTAAEVTDVNGALFDVRNNFDGCIAGIHEVLRRQGFFSGIYCYPGNERLSPGQQAEIDRVYRTYPHLHDDVFVQDNLQRWLQN